METQPELATKPISVGAYWHLVRGNRNFRNLWMAQIVSEIGDWFYTVSLYTLLLQLTGRASSVALALMLQVFPQSLISPAAGVINDRISRKKVMIISDLMRAGIVAAMLLVRSRSTVWLVYPLLFLETVMWAFFEPARTAVIPNITGREEVLVANTLSSTTWSLNLMIGSAVGGLIAVLFGRDTVFVLNTLSFLVSAFFISRMRFKEPHSESSPPLRARDLFDYSPILEGVRYVRSQKRLLVTVFAKTGEFMIGPSWVLFTLMGERYFPVRAFGLDAKRGAMLGMSMLLGARGLGAIIGPLISSRWAGQSTRRLSLGILFGYLLTAIGYSCLGMARNVWIACLCIVLGHCGGSIVWVFSTTLLQLHTEDRFRGRVFSAELAFAMSMLGAGAFLTGQFLDAGISARTVTTVVGLLMLIPAAIWARAMRLWQTNGA